MVECKINNGCENIDISVNVSLIYYIYNIYSRIFVYNMFYMRTFITNYTIQLI